MGFGELGGLYSSHFQIPSSCKFGKKGDLMVNGGLVVNSGLVVNGGLIDFLDGREDGRKIEPMKRMPHDSSPMWENASHRPVSYVINRARIIRILRGWRCSRVILYAKRPLVHISHRIWYSIDTPPSTSCSHSAAL